MDEKRELNLQSRIRLGGLISEFKQSEMHSEMVDYFSKRQAELDETLRGCTPDELPSIQAKYFEINAFFEWLEEKEAEGKKALREMDEEKSRKL